MYNLQVCWSNIVFLHLGVNAVESGILSDRLHLQYLTCFQSLFSKDEFLKCSSSVSVKSITSLFIIFPDIVLQKVPSKEFCNLTINLEHEAPSVKCKAKMARMQSL